MTKVQMLRSLINQRLSAAAEEIFGLFEKTISEYEEQLHRSKEENKRKQKLLDDVFRNLRRSEKADVQQLPESEEEVPSEQLDFDPGLDQEDAEPPPIKEEEEDLWSRQEEQEVYTVKFPFMPVSVKNEDDEEEPQSSQLQQTQSEENCEGQEANWLCDPERHLHLEGEDKEGYISEVETDISDDWRETAECQLGLKSLENFDDKRAETDKKSHKCCECGKLFKTNRNLVIHMRTHTGEKPFSCSQCGRKFTKKVTLTTHMLVHTEEKPFSCSRCGKRFKHKSNQHRHMLVHTGEKPFSCNVCLQRFSWSSQVKRHKCVLDQSSELHLNQTQEEGESETEANVENCGEPEPARSFDLETILT